MTRQTWHVIDLYSPAVEALLDDRGDTIIITQEMVDELLIFLSELEKRADDNLRQIVQDERVKIQGKSWSAYPRTAPG